jgi:UDP-N-acetylglucosamine 4,6-dehydratase
MNILDLAKAVAPECPTTIIGIRPGEKLHEVLIPEDDARWTVEYDDNYVILPPFQKAAEDYAGRNGGKICEDGFRYSSDTNDRWLSAEDLRQILGSTDPEHAEEKNQ